VRIEVDPGRLGQVGATHADLAGQVTELRGRLDAVGMQAAAAAGDPTAGAAAEGCARAWSAALGALAVAAAKLGANAQAAAGAYTSCDEQAIPAGP